MISWPPDSRADYGSLGIAIAKVAIAGNLGMDLTIPGEMRPDYFLFSESLGRFLVTVAPLNKRAFEPIAGPDAILWAGPEADPEDHIRTIFSWTYLS